MAKMKLPKLSKKIKLPGFVKDLATNKYVLYIVAFFALTNILGYMMLGKNVCVLLFILIAYITTYFTKNMVFVLLVPMFLVGFFAICKTVEEVREGMEHMKKGKSVESKDGTKKGTITEVKDEVMTISFKEDGSDDEEEIEVPLDTEEWVIAGKAAKKAAKKEEEEEEDPDAAGPEKKTEADDAEASEEFTTKGKKQDYVDHAATLDKAYNNLQSMLGEGGIKGLTAETQSLVKNQTQLAEAMKGMGPLLDQAQSMLKTMNLGALGKDIDKMTKQIQGVQKDGFTSKISPLVGSAY